MRKDSEIAVRNLLTSLDPVARLVALTSLRREVVEELDRAEFELVRQARARPKLTRPSWQEIGDATGRSRSQALRRFEDERRRFE
jgi:hypothetical protein